MNDKYAFRTTAFSLYALALAIFISVSLIAVYHILLMITFFVLLNCKKINFKNIPESAWALLAFIGTQLLSAAINFSEMQDKLRSIGGIKYPLIAILGLLIFQNKNLQNDEFLKKHSKIAFNIFLATIIIAFFYSVVKTYSEMNLLNSHYEDPVQGIPNTRLGGLTDIMRYGYGSAIVILLLLSTVLNLKKFPGLNRNFILVTIAVGTIGMFMSYTRGALIGLLLGVPVIFYYFNKRLTIILGLVSIAIVSFMTIISLIGGSSSSRFLLSANSTSNVMRMSQYLSAIHAIEERPIFGFGPQQLKHQVLRIKEKHNLEYKQYSEHAHNVYLEITANSGFFGLIAFLVWLCLWTKELYLQHNAMARQMFFPVILFFLIPGQFEMLLMAQTSTLLYFCYSITQLNIFKKEPIPV